MLVIHHRIYAAEHIRPFAFRVFRTLMLCPTPPSSHLEFKPYK